ncbi:MAG: hypothetical protein KME30_16035 [Iphinoe sp. HA4291-MV1]|nr:hypothetical protein [Iphinoe sp. HA4291-MV1]
MRKHVDFTSNVKVKFYSALAIRNRTPDASPCGDALATTGGTPLRVRQMPTEGDPPAALVSPQRTGSAIQTKPAAAWVIL